MCPAPTTMTDSIIATQRTRDRTFFWFCAWFSSRPRRHLPGSTRPRSERFASRPAPLGKTGRTTACFHHNSTFSDGLQALFVSFPFDFLLLSYFSDCFRTISCNLICPRERAPSMRPRRHLPSGRRSRRKGAGVGRANFAIMSVLRWLALANFAKHYILRTLARENRAYQARRPACLRAGTLPTREAQERGSPAPGATAT
jgi:hypothetical protein